MEPDIEAPRRYYDSIRRQDKIWNAARGLYSSQNVEDNVETPLLLRDIDSKTPLWQHDNAWIRLPAYFVYRILWLAVLKPPTHLIVRGVAAVYGALALIVGKVGAVPRFIVAKVKAAVHGLVDVLWNRYQFHPFVIVMIVFSLVPLSVALFCLLLLAIICVPIPYIKGQCHYHGEG